MHIFSFFQCFVLPPKTSYVVWIRKTGLFVGESTAGFQKDTFSPPLYKKSVSGRAEDVKPITIFYTFEACMSSL
jgi:hypothetical protein